MVNSTMEVPNYRRLKGEVYRKIENEGQMVNKWQRVATCPLGHIFHRGVKVNKFSFIILFKVKVLYSFKLVLWKYESKNKLKTCF